MPDKRYHGRKTELNKYEHSSEYGKRYSEDRQKFNIERKVRGSGGAGGHREPHFETLKGTVAFDAVPPYTGDRLGLFKPKILIKYKWIPLLLLGLFVAYQLYNDRSTPTVVLPFVNLPEQTHFSASTLNRN